MIKRFLGIVMALVMVLVPLGVVGAATTADVTVNATPAYISITVSPTTYAFGIVQESGVYNSTTSYFTVTNTATTVTTNNTISVNASAWASGGTGWTHSDAGTPDVNTAALEANKGGTWGSGDVVVKYASPLILALNQTALTNWNFGLQLRAPTSIPDGQINSILVRVTAAYTG